MGGRRGKKNREKNKKNKQQQHVGDENGSTAPALYVFTPEEMDMAFPQYTDDGIANRMKKYNIESESEDEDDDVDIESESESEDEDDDVVMRRSKHVLYLADYTAKLNSKIPGKFPREWREMLRDQCIGLPVCTLLKAFRERYGIVPRVNDLSEDPRVFQDKGEGSNTLKLVADDGGGEGECSSPHLDCDSVEMILARLPFPSLMRAKSVCKAWNRAIGALNVNVETDHHFLTHHISNGYHGIAFFSSSLNRWFRIPLEWGRWTRDCSQPSHPPELYLCAAGGGLFLFVDWHSGRDSPVVFNPLTKQHRVLPDIPLMDGWRPIMAVELIAETDHFKVIIFPVHVAVNWDVDPLLYNSSTDKWTSITITGTNPTTGIYWSDSHPWSSTFHNGTVYCTNSFGHHLGRYDIASGEFKLLEIEGGSPPQVDCHDNAKNTNATLPALLVCSGKLILVGRIQRKAGEGSLLGRLPLIKHTLVGLWELDENAKIKRWSLISLTPPDLLKDTVESSDGTDFLVSASDHADQIWLMLRGSMNILSFNVRSMEWSVLPGCPAEDLIDTTRRRALYAPLRISPCI